jgi:hypothetical protein
MSKIKPIDDENDENELLIEYFVEKLNSYNIFDNDNFNKLIINATNIPDEDLRVNFIFIIGQYKKYHISCLSCLNILRGNFMEIGDYCRDFLTDIVLQRNELLQNKEFLHYMKLF